MGRPVIALLTDFGLRDHYVGVMKGVALGVCPDATFVDISHEVPAHDVVAGALELEAAYRYFPPGTVFLAVVDPGVGSSRLAIAAAAGGYRLVGPDNGLLSLVLAENPPSELVELREPRFARPEVSPTFEGRGRFAPAAGWLAAGVAMAALGPRIEAATELRLPPVRVEGHALEGEVLRVDRFGNLVTNIDGRTLERWAGSEAIEVTIAGRRIAGLVATYADRPAGALCALIGSNDRLEVAVNGASAAGVLAAARGAPVRVSRPA
jgi:S-adenosylmethionine hydrolase